jgi:site-specific DNA-methyltransferase (adenine-specific)
MSAFAELGTYDAPAQATIGRAAPAFEYNVMQRGDALELLQSLPPSCSPAVFLDPQHRSVLDRQRFGNEGQRQRGRAALPPMSDQFIDEICREAARVARLSGYLFLWADT